MHQDEGVPGPPDPQQDTRQRDNDTMRLMITLYRDMVAEENIPPDKVRCVTTLYFFEWFRRSQSKYNSYEVTEKLNMSEEIWFFLSDIAHSQAGPDMLRSLWPQVLMADVPPSKHKLTRMINTIYFYFDDDTVSHLTMPMSPEMAGGVMTEGYVLSLLTQMMGYVVNEFQKKMFDGIHALGQYMGGDNAFDVMMGVLLQAEKQMKEPHATNLKKWMRMLQLSVRPPLAAISARLEKNAKEALDKQAGTDAGGWVG